VFQASKVRLLEEHQLVVFETREFAHQMLDLSLQRVLLMQSQILELKKQHKNG
jgi:hypothetical protein